MTKMKQTEVFFFKWLNSSIQISSLELSWGTHADLSNDAYKSKRKLPVL